MNSRFLLSSGGFLEADSKIALHWQRARNRIGVIDINVRSQGNLATHLRSITVFWSRVSAPVAWQCHGKTSSIIVGKVLSPIR